MAKYSYEFKKKIVQEYLDGNGGYEYLAKKYNIAKDTQVMDWVKAYQTFGNDGLMRSRQNNNYSFQMKQKEQFRMLSLQKDLALRQAIRLCFGRICQLLFHFAKHIL
ncbi:MAG: transposase [Clostridia bacterium]|nr:transposase [Clostridia bacterium]